MYGVVEPQEKYTRRYYERNITPAYEDRGDMFSELCALTFCDKAVARFEVSTLL